MTLLADIKEITQELEVQNKRAQRIQREIGLAIRRGHNPNGLLSEHHDLKNKHEKHKKRTQQEVYEHITSQHNNTFNYILDRHKYGVEHAASGIIRVGLESQEKHARKLSVIDPEELAELVDYNTNLIWNKDDLVFKNNEFKIASTPKTDYFLSAGALATSTAAAAGSFYHMQAAIGAVLTTAAIVSAGAVMNTHKNLSEILKTKQQLNTTMTQARELDTILDTYVPKISHEDTHPMTKPLYSPD